MEVMKKGREKCVKFSQKKKKKKGEGENGDRVAEGCGGYGKV